MDFNEDYRLTRRDGEFLRVVASILVVAAHCVHFWVEDFYSTRNIPSLGFFATFIDQFTRFTVPVFFFLSGFGLTSQFLQKPPKLSTYYRFRLGKIFAPFLLWSFITAFRHIDYLLDEMPWREAFVPTALRFLKFLFIDGFDYQYYFVIVIFQFYLLFPLIFKLAKNRWFLLGVLLLQLAFMSPVEGYLEPFGWELPAFHSNLLLFYGFYCVAGMYAAWHRDFLSGILRHLSNPQVVFFWVGSFGLILAEYWLNIKMGKGLYDSDHFNRWSVVLYCVACLLLFVKMKPALQTFFQNRHWVFLFTGIAPYTFFVYLAHTHVLRIVDFLSWEVTITDFFSRIVWVVLGSYALAWLAQWLLEDYPKLRFALGLPKTPLRAEDLPGHSYLSSRLLRSKPSDSVPVNTASAVE